MIHHLYHCSQSSGGITAPDPEPFIGDLDLAYLQEFYMEVFGSSLYDKTL